MRRNGYRKRCLTLIEIMIVMFLIAMITGVVAYNYRSTLDQGRAFKSREGIERIRTILLLETASNPGTWDEVSEGKWVDVVKRSPLANNPDKLIYDGWGNLYDVQVVNVNGERDIQVSSSAYTRYLENHPGQ